MTSAAIICLILYAAISTIYALSLKSKAEKGTEAVEDLKGCQEARRQEAEMFYRNNAAWQKESEQLKVLVATLRADLVKCRELQKEGGES